ncbi:hypothetical protein CERSUDRAFT_112964 [Gelatoporia subvermispora B]|uniref:Uncharacterized protein n=1 Tax=Ceriporiopsis subvermispora (strain B) TaxID=914234 RepID=M2R448_CERS8|nr:hypothetical protein CERSUDRAFT_112964 [Gelatoporia subvermispora B]
MENTFPPPRRWQARTGAPAPDVCAVRHALDDSAIHPKRPAVSRSWSTDLMAESVTASSSGSKITATKIVNSVRRSFSVTRRRGSGSMSTGMYSTPEESTPPAPSRFNVRDAYDTRPTIQQIAMGLHVSRTPHLRSPRLGPQPYTRSHFESASQPYDSSFSSSRPNLHRRRTSVPAVSLPPPPARSSLKKPASLVARSNSAPTSAPLTPSASDASLSTLTSTTPSTPRSTRSASVPFVPARLHLSMSRLLPGRKNSGASSATARESDDDSASAELTPRKVVRFSTSTHEGG